MDNKCPKCNCSQNVDSNNLVMGIYAKCKKCGELFIFNTSNEKQYSHEIENLLKYKCNKRNSELLLSNIHLKTASSEQGYSAYFKKNKDGLKILFSPSLFSKLFGFFAAFIGAIGSFFFSLIPYKEIDNFYLQITVIMLIIILFFAVPSWIFIIVMSKDKTELIITKTHILLLSSWSSFFMKKHVEETYLLQRNNINKLTIKTTSYMKRDKNGTTKVVNSDIILDFADSKPVVLFRCGGKKEPKILKNYLEKYLFNQKEI